MGSLAKTYFDVGTYTGQGNYQRIGEIGRAHV